ncbi:hypothetical protein Bca52824_023717 [Brassica carinata]|uniref:Uncharacterized protein n=1 Tax=Brassica carinata TaxID=52824 RepID=A0A8X8ATE6_BRACI|nr:hypothetical protein Bca52824_023717 [Brassica carinata]
MEKEDPQELIHRRSQFLIQNVLERADQKTRQQEQKKRSSGPLTMIRVEAEDNHLNRKDPYLQQKLIDTDCVASIDKCPEFGKRAFRYGVRKLFWEQRDEYRVYRDENGFARGIDGDVIRISKDDIKKLLQRTSMDERSYICLLEHASSFKRRELVQETYTKDEINEMFTGLLGERKWEKLSMEKSLEEATDKLRSEMNWMFSADQGLLKRVQRLELELEDLRNTQNHS